MAIPDNVNRKREELADLFLKEKKIKSAIGVGVGLNEDGKYFIKVTVTENLNKEQQTLIDMHQSNDIPLQIKVGKPAQIFGPH